MVRVRNSWGVTVAKRTHSMIAASAIAVVVALLPSSSQAQPDEAAPEARDEPTPAVIYTSEMSEAAGLDGELGELVEPAAAQRGTGDAALGADASTADTDELLTRSGKVADLRAALGLELDATDVPEGFVGTYNSAAALTLHIWWVGGELPAPLQQIAQEYPEVSIAVHDADRDKNSIEAAIESSGIADAPGVNSVSTRVDGSAVIVDYSQHTGEVVDAEEYAARIDMPLVMLDGSAELPAAGGRTNDTVPANGGALIRTPVSGTGPRYCSTGFVLRRTNGSTSTYRMISASHCVSSHPDAPIQNPYRGGAWGNPQGVGLYPGATAGEIKQFPKHDFMVMNLGSGGTFSPNVYRGHKTSSAEGPVVGAVPSSTGIGDMVATSGGNTGEHLGKVTGTRSLGTCGNECLGFIAEPVNRQTTPFMVGTGDSGGPVITASSNGAVRVAGIISTLYGGTPCNAASNLSTSTCSDEVGYIPTKDIIAYLKERDPNATWTAVY